MTFGARNVFPVPAQKNPDLDFVFFSLEPLEETLDSFVAALAFEDELFPFVFEIFERNIGGNPPGLRFEDQFPHQPARDRLGPGFDGSLFKRFVLVGEDFILVQDGQVAEPVADGTGSLRTVEGEEIGERLFIQDISRLALEPVGENELLVCVCPDLDFSVPFTQADLEGVHKPFSLLSFQSHPVDEDIDRAFFFELGFVDMDSFILLDDPEKAAFSERT